MRNEKVSTASSMSMISILQEKMRTIYLRSKGADQCLEMRDLGIARKFRGIEIDYGNNKIH